MQRERIGVEAAKRQTSWGGAFSKGRIGILESLNTSGLVFFSEYMFVSKTVWTVFQVPRRRLRMRREPVLLCILWCVIDSSWTGSNPPCVNLEGFNEPFISAT